MTGSDGLTPLLFVIVIGLVLVWQVLGGIGSQYSLLRRIGAPWRGVPEHAEPAAVDSGLALMVWADEGGAEEKATRL